MTYGMGSSIDNMEETRLVTNKVREHIGHGDLGQGIFTIQRHGTKPSQVLLEGYIVL